MTVIVVAVLFSLLLSFALALVVVEVQLGYLTGTTGGSGPIGATGPTGGIGGNWLDWCNECKRQYHGSSTELIDGCVITAGAFPNYLSN
jgi:hypothetical protein